MLPARLLEFALVASPLTWGSPLAQASPITLSGLKADTLAVGLGTTTDVLWTPAGLFAVRFGQDDVADGDIVFAPAGSGAFSVFAAGGMVDPVRLVRRGDLMVVGDADRELQPSGKLWTVPFSGGSPTLLTSELFVAPRPAIDVPAGFLVASQGGNSIPGDGALFALAEGGGTITLATGIDPVDASLDPSDGTQLIVADYGLFQNPSDGRLLRIPITGGTPAVVCSGLGDPMKLIPARPPFGTENELLVCDRELDQVLVFDPVTGDTTRIASGFGVPNGISLSDHNDLYVVNADGTLFRISPVVTGVGGEVPRRAQAVALDPGCPNPFRQSTRLGYRAPQGARVTLDVLDTRGRRVVRVYSGMGPGAAEWSGRDHSGRRVAPGSYTILLRSGDASTSRRVMVLP